MLPILTDCQPQQYSNVCTGTVTIAVDSRMAFRVGPLCIGPALGNSPLPA